MYVYIILKLDVRFFNVFILDLFFYFCFLFLYTDVCISIIHYNYCCIIVQSIIYIIHIPRSKVSEEARISTVIHTPREDLLTNTLRVYLVGIYQPWIYGVAEYM